MRVLPLKPELGMTISHDNPPIGSTEASDLVSRALPYGPPRKVWVDDGHVLVEAYDGTVVRMVPEVAIELGRMLGNSGAESLVNKVVEEAAKTSMPPATDLTSL
jgi:hypothetical protein